MGSACSSRSLDYVSQLMSKMNVNMVLLGMHYIFTNVVEIVERAEGQGHAMKSLLKDDESRMLYTSTLICVLISLHLIAVRSLRVPSDFDLGFLMIGLFQASWCSKGGQHAVARLIVMSFCCAVGCAAILSGGHTLVLALIASVAAITSLVFAFDAFKRYRVGRIAQAGGPGPITKN